MTGPRNFRVYVLLGILAISGLIVLLREHGPSPLHRQSFAPVWNAPVPQEVLAFMLQEPEASPAEDLAG